ncbi:hypothetical protein QVD17_03763 [Tagetes erecta]|uniref:Uncharacterized protein n=1 Tax=Tagetes erecta TaxID=13708 RepID=A0AAD8LAK4_TARER|nr:hypothetical protein QVD17_03763 [Tagetes erecta]
MIAIQCVNQSISRLAFKSKRCYVAADLRGVNKPNSKSLLLLIVTNSFVLLVDFSTCLWDLHTTQAHATFNSCNVGWLATILSRSHGSDCTELDYLC